MRILAVDMDGTCLNKKNMISDVTLTWLHWARVQGYEIVPTTGRSLSCIPRQLSDEKLFRYCITSNGASVTDTETGKDVFSAPLPMEKALTLTKECAGPYIGMTAHDDHEYLVEGRFLWTLGRLSYGKDAGNAQIVRQLAPCIKERQSDVEELQFFFYTKKARARIRDVLSRHPELSAAYGGQYVEIYSKGASKGAALEALARQLSVPKEDIACIGDGENDIPMFQHAGTRFAMGNAVPALKVLADRVVASNDQNGVAEAIKILLHAEE